MGDRLKLHELLKKTIGNDNVYFQAPEGMKMKYPAIRYSLSRIENKHADDISYLKSHNYELTVIDPDPDSKAMLNISALPYCRFDRHYVSNNLHHYTFTIYY